MRISRLLNIGYSLFLLLIVIQTIFNLSIIKDTEKSAQKLENEIRPAVESCEELLQLSDELYLLIGKYVYTGDLSDRLRLNALLEVELEYYQKQLTENKTINNSSNTAALKTIQLGLDSLSTLSREILDNLILEKDFEEERQNRVLINLVKQNIFECHEDVNNELKLLRSSLQGSYDVSQKKLSESYSNIVWYLIVFAIIGSVFGFLASIVIKQVIKKQINKLVFATEQIALGNFEHRVQIQGDQELVLLGERYNEMARKLDLNIKKLTQVEEFAYITSHDLKEPLNTISSILHLLEADYAHLFDEQGKEYLQYIESSVNRMGDLLADLLDYNRIGSQVRYQKFKLNELVDHVVQDLKSKVDESEAEIVIKELPELNADKTDLRILFQNLIGNALKFRKEDVRPELEIYAEELKDHYKIAVADNGIGIESKYQDRIFKIFQRLHNKSDYEGTGIGLALCKKIVEIHKGDLWFESEPGKGTTFYFTISKNL